MSNYQLTTVTLFLCQDIPGTVLYFLLSLIGESLSTTDLQIGDLH
jgi:hypothetical protein